MTVNFNNLRKQALYNYDRLVNKLNDNIIKDNWDRKEIRISPDEIEEELNDLRMLIGSIAMSYEPDDENFKDIYSEVYPNENGMVLFNEDKN